MELFFPIVLDGDVIFHLRRQGFDGLCAEKWLLQHPDALIELQQQYLISGSRVLFTPTAGANRARLEQNGIFDSPRDYTLCLALLTMQASGTLVRVAGVLGSTGLSLTLDGSVNFQQLMDIYTQQAEALNEADVHLFVLDGMESLSDARAALLAVKQLSDKPVLVSFKCDADGKIADGADISAALTVMQGMGAEAFGLSGALSPEKMLPLLQRLRDFAEIPLMARPCAVELEHGGAECEDGLSPEAFASYAPELSEAGVALFGGGAGVSPEHIFALADVLGDCGINVPEPLYDSFFPCATPFAAAYLPSDTALPSENVSASPLLAAQLKSPSDLEAFKALCSSDKPLCIFSEDASLLEEALKLYQGRALYSGSLSESALEPLCNKYGLIPYIPFQ